MIFGRGGKAREHKIEVKIEGTTLLTVKENKFLGIMLDNCLTWKSHATYLSKKISKSIGILSRAKKFLNLSTLRQLYFSFVFPYLSYCNVIWGHAAESTLDPIFKLQKRAIRIMTNTRKRESTKLLFQKMKILRLPEMYKFSALHFTYKFKNNLLPLPFQNFYTENRAHHNHATRQATNLRIPLTRSKLADNFIKKTGVTLWNLYSQKMSHNMSIGSYKRELINLLLTTYSD